jgi:DNA (cytosine-5)-methyltransferase 1
VKKLKMLDLFSGIGGFSLAAHWTGQIETVAFCEIDPYCQTLLNLRFPGIPICKDIRSLNYEWIIANAKCGGLQESGKRKQAGGSGQFYKIDILTAGTPCQPASCAGRRAGKNDDRWLWPETFRVVKDTKPKWCILENVRGLLSLEQGMVFEDLCLELEVLGYETRTFVIPAVSLGAWHRRDRIWIVAHTRCEYGEGAESGGEFKGTVSSEKTTIELERPTGDDGEGDAGNSQSTGLQGSSNGQGKMQYGRTGKPGTKWHIPWLEVATELCSVDDGLPAELGEFKCSKSKHREYQLKGYGNAIVPQIAYQIFMAIIDAEKLETQKIKEDGK